MAVTGSTDHPRKALRMPHKFINAVPDIEKETITDSVVQMSETSSYNKQVLRKGYLPRRHSDFKMPKGAKGDFTGEIKARVLRPDVIDNSIVKESVGTAKEPAGTPGRNCVLDKLTKLFKCTQPNVKQ